ncbi:Transcription initiation factor [Globisporangium polare]
MAPTASAVASGLTVPGDDARGARGVPTAAEDAMDVLPELPLLSAGERKIVHFAKLYQRAQDDDAFESLADLGEELAAVARQRRKSAAESAAASPSAASSLIAAASWAGADGATANPNRLLYAPDQLQLLLTTRENPGEKGVADHLPQASKGADAKGKPMVRFIATSSSPFVSALNVESANHLRQALEQDQRDELYNKVQQIPWEDNILWGVDFAAKDRDANIQGGSIVETEDAGGSLDSTGRARDSGSSGFQGQRGATNQSAYGASGYDRSRTTGGGASTGSSFNRQATAASSSTTFQRAKSSTGRTEPSIIPTVSQAGENFDMIKPRNYRWEIEDDSNRKASTKAAGAITTATATATATAAAAAGKKDMKATTAKVAMDLPCPLNKDLQNDSWIDAIGWSSTHDMPESKLVLDDNDSLLIFSVPEMEDIRPTLRIPERKLGAAEQRLEQLDKQRREKKQRIDEVMGRLEFGEETAEGRLGTEGGGKKSKDTRVVKNIGLVHHSLPAIKLSLTKPELPKTKLRDFHRPRGKFKINERLQFAPPPNVTLTQKEESAMITQIKKSSDLNPTAGGKLILVEYTEQNPPMLSNPGMAARILHYWRPPEDDDSIGIGKKKAKKVKPKPPDMKMGQVITLGDHDESPFVGDIPPGRVVTSLNSKLFKVPIFSHKAAAPFAAKPDSRDSGEYELFLLCRSVSKGKKGGAIGGQAKTTVHVMEMPELFVAGQVEPQIEVPAPNSRSANDFIRPYMSFHILRLFKKASDGERLKIEDIARAFPNQSGTAIRKRMKEVATFERGGNDSGWWKKKAASQLTSEEEIRASIPPESVCLYESMMSGHRRLLDIGLTKLFTPAGVNGAINHLLKRLELRKQSLSAKLIEPLNLERRAKEKADEELWKSDPMIRKLETDIQVARYIDEQLQLTPWNLTNNYVECHLQGKGSGMLKLGGIGDPTGRGEGFSFVRVPQSRAKKKEGEEEAAAGGNASAEAAAVQKAVAAVTGTTADLRKLKMKEAGDVLRNLGLAEADIKKLRRWDRIHMVRELSSRATAHGVAGSLSKFARGARKSLSAQQQEYRKKCDVIYERQMDVLSSTKTTFSSDEESEGDDDLDEWEKDIEAGITGGNEMEKIAKRGPKNLFAKDGGGLNRSKEVLREREDAVELRRLMEEMKEDSGPASTVRRPDVDASKLRNQLRASGIKEGSAVGAGGAGSSFGSVSRPGGFAASRGGSVISSAIATPTDHMSRSSSPTHGRSAAMNMRSEPSSATKKVPGRKVLKRTTRTIEEDGTENVKIEFIVDERQIGRFKAMQQRKERQMKTEERNMLRKRKRMLALEDDSGSQSLLDKAKKRKQLQEELKQLQITEEQNKGYQEMLQKQGEESVLGGTPQKGVIRCTQCGQAGHMRTNRSCPLYMADEVRSSSSKKSASAVSDSSGYEDNTTPLKLKVKKTAMPLAGEDQSGGEKITVNLSELREGARKHHAEKKRKRLQEVKEQAELYKRPYMNNVVKQSRSRMPVEHLKSNLESVVDKLLDMPESELFRAAVDRALVKDYYLIIKQPMDLGTIKKKVDDQAYDSMREFIKDLELIVSNSKAYNGEPARSLITANAVKVLKRAQEELATLNAEGGVSASQQ